MSWTMLVLVGLAVMSAIGIVTQWRKVARPKDDDWDARFISQLRKAGIAPFEAHPVDFFFDLPTEQACQDVAAVLEPEGYVVDSRAEADTGRYSLHATFSMRLIVDEMKALTLRFRALAEEQGGKYDGWAVGSGKPRSVR